MYIMYTAYMNIDAAFSVSFPEAAARPRAPVEVRTATERDARGKEGLCEAERSESHANGEREKETHARGRERNGERRRRREGAREREKGTPGAHRIKESASE